MAAAVGSCSALASVPAAAQIVSYRAELESPGGPLRFGLVLTWKQDRIVAAAIRNGSEEIPIGSDDIVQRGEFLRVRFPHYDSEISAEIREQRSELRGQWTKRPRAAQPTVLPFQARLAKADCLPTSNGEVFWGRWELRFAAESAVAVGIFQPGSESPLEGTILTSTGDYRYLDGDIAADGTATLATFDGSHAFLLQIRPNGPDQLRGEFWSGAAFHDTFQGVRNDRAELADGFRQVELVDPRGWQTLQFPDLHGRKTPLAAQPLPAVTVVHLFGSWCPNCHDAANLFSQLDQKYRARGLRIVGLAFEQSGDPATDAAQVQTYIQRHGVTYPILLAGLADKQAASQQLPFLDRLRAFPTTVFIDGRGEIFAVYSGFSGPATGLAGERLARHFEELVREHLPAVSD